MSFVLQRNVLDAYVAQFYPSRNFNNTTRLFLAAAGAGNERFAYLYFGRPYPKGANILSAKLRFYNGTTWAGSVTASVKRASSKWGDTTINYTNKPGTTGTTATLAKTGAAANTMWEVDVTSMLQTVANGAAWYGFRISVDGTTTKWIHSSLSTAAYRPTLEITWSDAPDAPETLQPDGNRAVHSNKPTLQFDFTDVSGDTTLSAALVEIASTEAILLANTAEWKSPELPITEPEVDLTTTTYPGLAEAGTAWWRVKVKDGAGIWSLAWSDPAQFRRVAKLALTLTAPAASPNNFIYEHTPPIIFQSAAYLKHYQIIVTRLADQTVTWDTGKVLANVAANTPVTVTPQAGAGVFKYRNEAYNIRVLAWDNVDRENTPDAKTYQEISRDVVFGGDAAVAAVTSLAVSQNPTGFPWMNVTWDRSSAPDSYEIWRDDKLVETDIIPAEVLLGGTSYLYQDKTVSPRVSHTWKVVPIVNGKGPSVNPTASGSTKAGTVWLMEKGGVNPIIIANPEYDGADAEVNALHEVLADAPPVLISQSVRGYEGSVRGLLVDNFLINGASARTQRDSFKAMIKKRGGVLHLFLVDEFFECFITNAKYRPIADPYGVSYEISFDFYQTDI